VIVVFNNEIRSILQAANLKTIFWGSPVKPSKTPVEIIIDSVIELAKKRIGALIVIPGKDNINAVLQKGIPWEGLVSKEMLLSIFWHDNPVHDGAIIIEGERITQVGVILPLSQREDLPFYFGTRHRAAAGIAERSDALVLLVSEERGELIAVKQNRMQVIRNAKNLELILNDHLGISIDKTEKIKKEKQNIAFAAVLSVVFITSIWLSIARGFDTLVTLEIPIEYVKSNQETEIAESPVNTARLYLSGSSFLVKSIRPGQVRVRKNIDKALEGKNIIPITHEDVSLPPGIMLKKIEPPEVEVIIAKPAVKSLPVQVDWQDKLDEDLILTEVKITPSYVKVGGNTQALNSISTIFTEKISLNQIHKKGKKKAFLVLDNPALKWIENKNTVEVEYFVEKRR
jgi:hypothetical protein